MTPREKLAKAIQEALAGNADATQAETLQILILKEMEGYAIGQWMPVKERLPEADRLGEWAGMINHGECVTSYNGEPEKLKKAEPVFKLKNLHWLDLDVDMPKEASE